MRLADQFADVPNCLAHPLPAHAVPVAAQGQLWTAICPLVQLTGAWPASRFRIGLRSVRRSRLTLARGNDQQRRALELPHEQVDQSTDSGGGLPAADHLYIP